MRRTSLSLAPCLAPASISPKLGHAIGIPDRLQAFDLSLPIRPLSELTEATPYWK